MLILSYNFSVVNFISGITNDLNVFAFPHLASAGATGTCSKCAKPCFLAQLEKTHFHAKGLWPAFCLSSSLEESLEGLGPLQEAQMTLLLP